MHRLRRTSLWLALLLAACGTGGGGSGGAEVVAGAITTPTTVAPIVTRPGSTTTSTTLLAGVEQRSVDVPGSPIVLRFDGEVGSGVLALVEEMLPVAREELGDSGSLMVHVYGTADVYVGAHDARTQADARADIDAGLIAEARTAAIWIYAPRFVEQTASTRRMIIFHEYFHTIQAFLSSGRSSRAPLWLREGTARYFEFRVGADYGYTDFSRRRATAIREATDLEPLQSYENRGAAKFRGGQGEAYTLGFLAAEYLEQLKGADFVKRDLWVAFRSGTTWQTAFAAAVGVPVEQFYADFEAYRATL